MSVKRKLSTTTTIQSKAKILKKGKSNTEASKPTRKPSKTSKYEESDVSSDDDEFEGFGSNEDGEDMDENDMDSAIEDDSDEEDELDDGSVEMEIDEDSTKDSKPAKQIASGTSATRTPSLIGTQNDMPSHAAQRALAKERKLQRPNGTSLNLENLF
jgi:hypothetical protein